MSYTSRADQRLPFTSATGRTAAGALLLGSATAASTVGLELCGRTNPRLPPYQTPTAKLNAATSNNSIAAEPGLIGRAAEVVQMLRIALSPT